MKTYVRKSPLGSSPKLRVSNHPWVNILRGEKKKDQKKRKALARSQGSSGKIKRTKIKQQS